MTHYSSICDDFFYSILYSRWFGIIPANLENIHANLEKTKFPCFCRQALQKHSFYIKYKIHALILNTLSVSLSSQLCNDYTQASRFVIFNELQHQDQNVWKNRVFWIAYFWTSGYQWIPKTGDVQKPVFQNIRVFETYWFMWL